MKHDIDDILGFIIGFLLGIPLGLGLILHNYELSISMGICIFCLLIIYEMTKYYNDNI